jgi:hypothetical protein
MAKEADPRCGLLIIDLKTGEVVHWIRLEGEVTELYDIQVLEGVKREHLTFVTPKSGFMSSYFKSLARNQF